MVRTVALFAVFTLVIGLTLTAVGGGMIARNEPISEAEAIQPPPCSAAESRKAPAATGRTAWSTI